MIDSGIVEAWRQAGVDFRIRVEAPHRLVAPDGTELIVEAFVPDFGGPMGTIAVAIEDKTRCALVAKLGHFVSQLGPSYRVFERRRFRDTLNDWGWSGPPEARPDWYTGAPWS
jgi:hypothetical protein